MIKKTIIIFSLFIAVAMVSSVFIYLYRLETQKLIAVAIGNITICGNILDEVNCLAKNHCQGIYGLVSPDDPQLEFKNCGRIPLPVQIQLEQEKQLCLNTSGQWYRNKLGNFCLCNTGGSTKTFDQVKGCI